MHRNNTLVLSQKDIQKLIINEGIDQVMDLLIERLEEAAKNFDPVQTKIPVRSGFNYEKPDPGLVEWMPLYNVGEEITIKLVGYHPNNPGKYDLPTILSSISSYDTKTGHLFGIMDGVLPTALRTGAASAVASKFLAKADSSVLGIIGCGAQSVTQLHALSRIFDFEKVLIYDTDQLCMDSFQHRIQFLEIDVDIHPASISEIISTSDIVSSATSIGVGEGPLFADMQTLPHLHINAVGSDFPGKVELPIDLLKRSFVCPDFLEQALIEGESQQLLKGYIGPELHQIVKLPESYKQKREVLTIFDSTGWALEDQVVFSLFKDLSEKYNIGEYIAIEYVPEDAKNPYDFIGVSLSKINN